MINKKIRLLNSFFSQLGMLLNSGLDLKTSLELLKNDKQNKLSQLSELLIIQINNGQSFNEALSENKLFSKFSIYSCKSGEETGNLGFVCTSLGEFYQKILYFNKQLSSSLLYPFSVLLVAFTILLFMIFFVVPMFQEIYNQFNAPLPIYTSLLIKFSTFLSSNYAPILVFILLIILLLFAVSKSKSSRQKILDLISNAPLLKTIFHSFNSSIFANGMALMLKASMPLHRAIEISVQIVPSTIFKNKLENILGYLMAGESVSISFEKENLLKSSYSSIVKVSESVNSLDSCFEKIANNLEKELENNSKVFGKLLEPILIIFISIFVGGILLALYVPLFNLSSVIE